MLIFLIISFHILGAVNGKCGFDFLRYMTSGHLRVAKVGRLTKTDGILKCVQNCMLSWNCSGIYFGLENSECVFARTISDTQANDGRDSAFIATALEIWPSRLSIKGSAVKVSTGERESSCNQASSEFNKCKQIEKEAYWKSTKSVFASRNDKTGQEGRRNYQKNNVKQRNTHSRKPSSPKQRKQQHHLQVRPASRYDNTQNQFRTSDSPMPHRGFIHHNINKGTINRRANPGRLKQQERNSPAILNQRANSLQQKPNSQGAQRKRPTMTKEICERLGIFSFHAPTKQCFLYSKQRMRWSDANDVCTKYNSQLAQLKSGVEFEGLKDWLNTGERGAESRAITATFLPGIWYGLRGTPNGWKWFDGTTESWTGIPPSMNGVCMYMKGGQYHVSRSASCNRIKNSVCQMT